MAVQGGSFGPIRAQQHDRRRIAVRVNVLVPSMREVLTGLAERRLGGVVEARFAEEPVVVGATEFEPVTPRLLA